MKYSISMLLISISVLVSGSSLAQNRLSVEENAVKARVAISDTGKLRVLNIFGKYPKSVMRRIYDGLKSAELPRFVKERGNLRTSVTIPYRLERLQSGDAKYIFKEPIYGPIFLIGLRPDWPDGAWERGESGYVDMHFTVDTDGRAILAEVIDTNASKDMQAAALKLVNLSFFLPDAVDDELVRSDAYVRVEFPERKEMKDFVTAEFSGSLLNRKQLVEFKLKNAIPQWLSFEAIREFAVNAATAWRYTEPEKNLPLQVRVEVTRDPGPLPPLVKVIQQP